MFAPMTAERAMLLNFDNDTYDYVIGDYKKGLNRIMKDEGIT